VDRPTAAWPTWCGGCAASPDFARLWAAGDVRAGSLAAKRLRHPAVGWLELECKALHDPYRDQW
jgi:hypothetical protein